MWFEDFKDGCHGGHLRCQNETILAILNLRAASMLSTKFLLYQLTVREQIAIDFHDGGH